MTKDKVVPVKKNEYYKMIVDNLGSNGEGIGKIAGYTIFVEGALPEEEIEVKIIKTKKNYGFGKLVKILKPSSERIEPVCEIFNKCGGCDIQHLSYERQLEYKKQKVEDALSRIGEIVDVKVENTIGMDNPYNYRNKVQLPVGGTKGIIDIGFYAKRSHRIIETTSCHLQDKENEEIINIIKAYMMENNVRPYDEKNHKGLIRHIVTRKSNKDGSINITIVINGNKLPNQDLLINRLSSLDNIKGICLNINKEKTNVIFGQEIKTIWGQDYIIDSISDIEYKITPKSFYQVNPKQTKILYEKALEYADLDGDEIVWDAYCGIGTITLFLAKKAKKVYGVEIVEEAINDAIENARLNDINNVEFFIGKAEEIITKKYKEENIIADVIVVDPPRKGCDEALLNTIIKMEPKKLVYVSCDPATLARDLKILVANGYKVMKVQPVDMFPQTVHVETVVLIVKGEVSL